MTDHHSKNEKERKEMSRRTFIKHTGYVTGGLVGGGLLGGWIGHRWFPGLDDSSETKEITQDFQEARMFFKREEDFEVLAMAAETIFPEDHHGPGAIGLGVPYFIDRQLAGAWGNNIRDYMKGPFREGAETQGYQGSLTRGEIMLQGIRLINKTSLSKYNQKFVDIKENERVSILTEFAEDKIKMRGVSSARFFKLLRQAVLEGAYADPLYGGNKNMEGWRMKGHPGAVISYLEHIEKDEFMKLDPVALKDH